MKNKKIYSTPEIEVTRFSFESILAGGDTDDVELQTIKQSVPENTTPTYGFNVEQ